MRTNLSTKAVLVSLNIRMWKATATDAEIAHTTEEQYGAEANTMKVIKELTPRSYLMPIIQISNIGRQEHYKTTLMGFTRGQQLLSVHLFDRYTLIQQEIKDEFIRSVSDFCSIYPEIMKDAPTRLGSAFREADFPTEAQIKTYFEYSHRFAPIPSTLDWRLEGIGQHDMSKIRAEVEEEVREMYSDATRQIYEKAREVLTSISNQAKSYKSGFPGSAQLRDATIANLKEVSDLVMKMNFMGDPILERVGKEMVEEFATIEAAELRKNAELREKIAATADRIKAKLI